MKSDARGRGRAGALLLAAVATVLTLGCSGGEGDDLPRQAISGKVTFQGEPLKSGMIQFQPAAGDAATAGGAGIEDGAYSIPQEQGLVPGTYKVTITSVAAAASAPGVMPGDSPPPAKEPIPAKYNSRSTLTAEVKAGETKPLDYDLLAK